MRVGQNIEMGDEPSLWDIASNPARPNCSAARTTISAIVDSYQNLGLLICCALENCDCADAATGKQCIHQLGRHTLLSE